MRLTAARGAIHRKDAQLPNHTLYENTDQRIAIFVDVQNMFYSAKTLHQSKIDYRKLLEEIVRGRKLVRAIAYVVQKAEVDQAGFLEALRRSGYEVKEKDLTVREDGSSKGDWKVQIALDAVTLEPKIDCVVLVSGDGDFVPLVELLGARGACCCASSSPDAARRSSRSSRAPPATCSASATSSSASSRT